jgi:hypothetical protein
MWVTVPNSIQTEKLTVWPKTQLAIFKVDSNQNCSGSCTTLTILKNYYRL